MSECRQSSRHSRLPQRIGTCCDSILLISNVWPQHTLEIDLVAQVGCCDTTSTAKISVALF